ncbi:hypothetical protein [Campylobacter concisus]|nr:hypothetical protein [Campylobacter concisus]
MIFVYLTLNLGSSQADISVFLARNLTQKININQPKRINLAG